MKRNKLNKDQRLFVSDFLNGLSIAWFSAGAIAPFFVEIDDKIKLAIQVVGSLAVSVFLFLVGVKNLSGK